MVVSVIVNVRLVSDDLCTTGGCQEARTVMPWLVGVSVLAVVLALARLFGPVFVSPAIGSWLLQRAGRPRGGAAPTAAVDLRDRGVLGRARRCGRDGAGRLRGRSAAGLLPARPRCWRWPGSSLAGALPVGEGPRGTAAHLGARPVRVGRPAARGPGPGTGLGPAERPARHVVARRWRSSSSARSCSSGCRSRGSVGSAGTTWPPVARSPPACPGPWRRSTSPWCTTCCWRTAGTATTRSGPAGAVPAAGPRWSGATSPGCDAAPRPSCCWPVPSWCRTPPRPPGPAASWSSSAPSSGSSPVCRCWPRSAW